MGTSVTKGFFRKHKLGIIAGIVAFSAVNFYIGWNKDELPSCNDLSITDIHIPAMYFDHTKNTDLTVYSKDVTVSEPKEITYDQKAGIRNCTAFATLRSNNDVKSLPFTYQIAWLNDKKEKYQIKIDFGI